MQTERLFPALQRLYPAAAGKPFVQQARALEADVTHDRVDGPRAGAHAPKVSAEHATFDMTPTVFLASAAGRLGPVLGAVLLLWVLVAWSAGWLNVLLR